MNLEERLDALTEKIKSADIPVINMAVYSDGDFAMRQVNFSAGALNCYSITKISQQPRSGLPSVTANCAIRPRY